MNISNIIALGVVGLAEWLRRQIRNLVGSSRAGSNPAADGFLIGVFVKYTFVLL